jgi:maltose O-acetyltransferase
VIVRSLKRLAWKLSERRMLVRLDRRIARLRALGMVIGEDVNLPASTWVDESHCFLIRIGDHCGFGDDCVILAHDALMDEFLNATRIGRIVFHPSCHIGARTVILPGVEIGPRTIVGANSVVSRTLPPDTVCAGAPARVLCSLDEFRERYRARIASSPTFRYDDYSIQYLTPERRAELVAAVQDGDAFIVDGGHRPAAAPKGEG